MHQLEINHHCQQLKYRAKKMLNATADYRIESFQLQSPSDIQQQWISLEQQSDCAFFLSWVWVGNWLKTFVPQAVVLRVWHQQQLVAIGIVVEHTERRHGMLFSKTLRLHQTGKPDCDQIFIEYNGFLTHRQYDKLQLEAACIDYLNEHFSWQELTLAGIEQQQFSLFQQLLALPVYQHWSTATYGVDLCALSQSQVQYAATLSANTRYQITRCLKLYRQQGEVKLVRMATSEAALASFHEMANWHIARWGDGPQQSGFVNAKFLKFHKNLLLSAAENIDVLELQVAGETVASIYNFIYNNKVYFYLGVAKPETSKQLKPGLLCHYLAITRYQELGFSYYDFMGGEARYKQQLAQKQKQLMGVSFQRPLLRFRLERFVRCIKHQFQHLLLQPRLRTESAKEAPYEK